MGQTSFIINQQHHNTTSKTVQALPATQLVKFEKGVQSKISNDDRIHTNKGENLCRTDRE